MLKLDSDSTVIIIGGNQVLPIHPNKLYIQPVLWKKTQTEISSETWILQMEGGGNWLAGAELLQPRHSHACAMVAFLDTNQKLPIVIGGYTSIDERTSSTEILIGREKTGIWVPGPAIPIKEGLVFHVGISSSSRSSDVYLIATTSSHSLLFKWIHCSMTSLDKCHWHNMKGHLRQRRTDYVALSPTRTVDCNPQGQKLDHDQATVPWH